MVVVVLNRSKNRSPADLFTYAALNSTHTCAYVGLGATAPRPALWAPHRRTFFLRPLVKPVELPGELRTPFQNTQALYCARPSTSGGCFLSDKCALRVYAASSAAAVAASSSTSSAVVVGSGVIRRYSFRDGRSMIRRPCWNAGFSSAASVGMSGDTMTSCDCEDIVCACI